MSGNTPIPDHFSTDHLLNDLKGRTVRGTSITLAAQAVKFVIQLTSIAVLARLLTPSDFGLVAMVTVITGLLAKFMDGGLSMATIQRQHVTHSQVSNLFWVNVGLGVMLALLTIASAPLISKLYDEPRLVWISGVMSASFLIGASTVQHTALLRRQMRFRAIAYIDLGSMALGVAIGILAASFGLGYWALVVMTLATSFTQLVLVWFASRWRPGWLQRGSGVRPLLGFGLNLTGANFIGYIASNITPFVVGVLGGPQQLGYYNRANSIVAIPTSQLLPPIISVLQPVLSRLTTDPNRFRVASISLLRKIALLALLITLLLTVTADWVVYIFLGPNWESAVLIVRLLAIFALVEPIATTLAMILIAAGRADVFLETKLISIAAIIAFTLLGSIWGALGVIASFAISGLLIRTPLNLWYTCRVLPFSHIDIYRGLAPLLPIGFVTFTFLVGGRYLLPDIGPVVGIITLTVFSFFIYLSVALLFPSTRNDIKELIALAPVRITRKKSLY